VADHVIVLEHGRRLISEPASALNVDSVRDIYLGNASRARASQPLR
jgi:hypothetical protein